MNRKKNFSARRASYAHDGREKPVKVDSRHINDCGVEVEGLHHHVPPSLIGLSLNQLTKVIRPWRTEGNKVNSCTANLGEVL